LAPDQTKLLPITRPVHQEIALLEQGVPLPFSGDPPYRKKRWGVANPVVNAWAGSLMGLYWQPSSQALA